MAAPHITVVPEKNSEFFDELVIVENLLENSDCGTIVGKWHIRPKTIRLRWDFEWVGDKYRVDAVWREKWPYCFRFLLPSFIFELGNSIPHRWSLIPPWASLDRTGSNAFVDWWDRPNLKCIQGLIDIASVFVTSVDRADPDLCSHEGCHIGLCVKTDERTGCLNIEDIEGRLWFCPTHNRPSKIKVRLIRKPQWYRVDNIAAVQHQQPWPNGPSALWENTRALIATHHRSGRSWWPDWYWKSGLHYSSSKLFI